MDGFSFRDLHRLLLQASRRISGPVELGSQNMEMRISRMLQQAEGAALADTDADGKIVGLLENFNPVRGNLHVGKTMLNLNRELCLLVQHDGTGGEGVWIDGV